jgi:hypothetical protein
MEFKKVFKLLSLQKSVARAAKNQEAFTGKTSRKTHAIQPQS